MANEGWGRMTRKDRKINSDMDKPYIVKLTLRGNYGSLLEALASRIFQK